MMKKSLIFISILFLFVIPIISAVEIEMKTNFNQGETLLAKVSGYFLEPILKENIFFYRGHVRAPMEYDVTKIGDEFYIYALLPENSNNYSIVIKNTRYMKGSQVSEEDIIKNFSITNYTADFSINPGFVITKDDFFIEVQNLQEDEITIQIKTENATLENSEGDSITLMSGEIKKINFELGIIQHPALKIIELSTENLIYEIPVYIFVEEEQEKNKRGFKIEPSSLNISIATNSSTTRIIYLYNTGQEKLINILLSVSDSLEAYINLSIDKIEELNKNSSIEIKLYLFSENEGNIKGNIKAKTEDETLLTYSAISLNFLKDYVPSEEDDEILITKTCLELDGTICGEDEECDEVPVISKNAICCLGECKKIEESPIGTIIGWGILIILVVFLIWFFLKRYRKAKKPIDLLKIARGKRFGISKPIRENKKIERPLLKRNISQPVSKFVRKPIYPTPKSVVKIVEKPVIKEVIKKVFVEKPKKPVPKYTASSNTKTYHKTSCKFSKLIEDKYKVSKDDLDYFEKQGYKPCKVCLK